MDITPQEFRETPFVVTRIQWIDNNRLILLSDEEHHRIAIYDFLKNRAEFFEWQLNDLFLPYPSGNMLVSLDIEYLLYTVAQPVIVPPDQDPMSKLAWRIVTLKGEHVLDYVRGIGDTAIWLPDSSGILLRDIDDSIVLVNVDGRQQLILDKPAGVLSYGLFNSSGSRVAYHWSTREHPFSLAVLDLQSGDLLDYCQSAINLEIVSWSADDRLVAFKVLKPKMTEIYALDIINNKIGTITPYQPMNDAVGADFVRVVGWVRA